MKQAILYLRYSDPKQDGGTSIEVQEKVCKNACLADGFEVVGMVKNEAVSASKTNIQRVAELLEYCKSKQGKFDVLMVYKLDRFARSQEQHHWLRGQLLKMNIVLRSATEKIDESPSGRLVEGVLAAVNEYDNEVKRERVKIAMWARVDQGLWPWNPTWGYMVSRKLGVKLSPHAIDPTCSEYIIKMFKKFSTGLVSMADLSREFANHKIINYRGKKLTFTVPNIYRMINNPYYYGFLKNKDGKLVKGDHIPLISYSIFEKCQNVQKSRERNINSKRMYNNPDFPLRRFVFCESCGKALTACWSKSEYGQKHAYYYCHNKECSKYSKMIKKSDFENKFLDYLRLVKPTDEFFEKFESKFVKRYEERKMEIKGDYLTQIEEVKQMEEEEGVLVEKCKNGILPDHLVKEQIDELEQKITLAKMQLTNTHAEELDITSAMDYAKSFIRTVDLNWLDGGLDTKTRLQRAIFPNGVFYGDKGYSNDKISPVFEIITTIAAENDKIVTLGRIELPSRP